MALNQKAKRVFLASAAGVLVITAGVKLVGSARSVPYLGLDDPLVPFITNRTVMVLSAIMELAVASLMIVRRAEPLRLPSIAWLATLFFSYRIGLWLINYNGPCPCLGGPVDWLGIRRTTAEWILNAIIGYLLVFGYGLWIAGAAGENDWRRKIYSRLQRMPCSRYLIKTN